MNTKLATCSALALLLASTPVSANEEIFSGAYNWTPDGPTLFNLCGSDKWFDVSSDWATQELHEFYGAYVEFMEGASSQFSNLGLDGAIYAYPAIYVKFRGQVLDEEPMMPSNDGGIRISEVIEMYTLFPDGCR